MTAKTNNGKDYCFGAGWLHASHPSQSARWMGHLGMMKAQRQQQIPFGDDNQKGNSNYKNNCKSKRRSRFLRYAAE
jgi:hypothetical protein